MFPAQPILERAFSSTGARTVIALPPEADRVELYNLTNIGTVAAAAGGAEPSLFQRAFAVRGMPDGSGYSYTNTLNTKTMVESILASGGNGFTFLDTSVQTPGSSRAITSVTAANPAVVATGDTSGLVANTSVVRMFNVTNMQQIASLDFTVGTVNAGVDFQLRYMNTTGFVAGGAGSYRIIPFDPIYYPRRRFISGITQAAQAVVTLTVAHGFTAGQRVKILVPSQFGMTQMNGLYATITAVTTGATNTITLDVDSSAFTAFAFPLSAAAAAGVSFPQVVPVGMAATSPYENLLEDATDNQALKGIQLDSAVIGSAGNSMKLIAYTGLKF